MTSKDKRIQRLRSVPTDYTYSEAKALAISLGYMEQHKGKTSGSRVIFIKETKNKDGKTTGCFKIMIHKPHPTDIMKVYAVKDFLNALERNGDI